MSFAPSAYPARSALIWTSAFLAMSSLGFPCQAVGVSSAWSRGGSWRADLTPVPALDEVDDETSFIFAGTELHRPASSSASISKDAASPPPQQIGTATATATAGPEVVEESDAGLGASDWEAQFAAGVAKSKAVVTTEEADAGRWAYDASGSAIPRAMLQAEELLASVESVPSAPRWKEKTAERALRVYYHAKWLAERNYARAAELRYREAARLARNSRRSVLASHAMARLGYFLISWRRTDEAHQALQEAMRLNSKSNPLAMYLHGVLERKASGVDLARLLAGEEQIINASEQPSEELELERQHLIKQIGFWREAETSMRFCFGSFDAASVTICILGHLGRSLLEAMST